MRFLTDVLRSRILPALVAALGVSFIAAGLLTYTSGTDASVPLNSPAPILSFVPSDAPTDAPSDGPVATPEPSDVALSSPSSAPTIAVPSLTPTDEPSGAPSGEPSGAPSDAPSAAPTTSPGGTAKPTGKPSATPVPTPAGGKRVATRIVIPAMDIDLPIVKPPGGSSTYPLCNVAMYLQNLSQPGYPGATYLYAHARLGMFLPLLDASKVNNGKAMIGMLVQVYTSDNMYFLYEVSEVLRHQLTLNDALAAKDQELWLQTSEGPRGTPGKLQLVATPLSNGPADPKDAHPVPKPVVCG